jgi:GAF domain-containing protein
MTMNNRLTNQLKNEAQRYTLAGVLFGLIFPILATVMRLAGANKTFDLMNAIILHLSDPLMWIIDTAPFFLGIFASIAGRRQDNLQNLYSELRLRETELNKTQITLEERVNSRTSDLERSTFDLETISAVSREISTIRDVNTLLNVSANLIRERFNYYHTAIFLLDDLGESAILQAASGAAAQQMIEQRYRFNIDKRSDLGTALREGHAYVSLDVAKDMVLTRNPLLPETISEIVLPLRVLSKTIGVLDIQSNRSIYFDERNIRTLGLLVDQLAAAIENARLLQRVEGTVNELNKAYRLETQKAWQTTVENRAATAYEYDGQQIRSIPNNLPIGLIKQLEAGKAVAIKEKTGIQDGINNALLVPIMVLNQVIGVIGLEQKDPNHAWTNEEIAVAEAAANRAALTLENARLIEESQRRALKERTISDATARIGTALNIENILDITALELERIIGESEVILQIDTESRPTPER